MGDTPSGEMCRPGNGAHAAFLAPPRKEVLVHPRQTPVVGEAGYPWDRFWLRSGPPVYETGGPIVELAEKWGGMGAMFSMVEDAGSAIPKACHGAA